jgi:hypothetical protein
VRDLGAGVLLDPQPADGGDQVQVLAAGRHRVPQRRRRGEQVVIQVQVTDLVAGRDRQRDLRVFQRVLDQLPQPHRVPGRDHRPVLAQGPPRQPGVSSQPPRVRARRRGRPEQQPRHLH